MTPGATLLGCWTTTLCALLFSLYVCCDAQPQTTDAGSKEHQCYICTALVNETLKKLQPKLNAGAQYPVTEAIANIESEVLNRSFAQSSYLTFFCAEPTAADLLQMWRPHFYIYNYAPATPATMMKALSIFVDNHGLSDVFEEPLSKAARKLNKSGSVSKILDQ